MPHRTTALGRIAGTVLAAAATGAAHGQTCPLSFSIAQFASGNRHESIALADMNGDGHLDVLVANTNPSNTPNSVSLFRGNGDGSLQNEQLIFVGTNPNFVTVGDFNGDGRADIVASLPGIGYVGVVLQQSNGLYTPVYSIIPTALQGTFALANSLAVGDFNHDGSLDLAVCDFSNAIVGVMLGNGDGTFRDPKAYPVGLQPNGLVAADINHDGRLDLIVANRQTNDVSILLGNADGTFQPDTPFPVGSTPRGVAVADFNHDGVLDLAVANFGPGPGLSILLGNGNGTFQAQQTYLTPPGAASVAVGDFNHDGIPDVAVSCYVVAKPTAHPPVAGSSEICFFRGNGDGTFQIRQDFAFDPNAQPRTIAAGALIDGGVTDLATANQNLQTVSLMANTSPLGPSIVTQPDSAFSPPGSTAEFTVQAEGPGPLSFRWRRNGTPLDDGAGVTGSHTAAMTIADVQPVDAGIYDVLVSNSCGTVTSAGAQLTVPANCPLDYDLSGILDPDDLSNFITDFFTIPALSGVDYSGFAGPAEILAAQAAGAPEPYFSHGYTDDYDQTGVQDPDDLSSYITDFFDLSNPCPR